MVLLVLYAHQNRHASILVCAHLTMDTLEILYFQRAVADGQNKTGSLFSQGLPVFCFRWSPFAAWDSVMGVPVRSCSSTLP
jgi:hypothetical protein